MEKRNLKSGRKGSVSDPVYSDMYEKGAVEIIDISVRVPEEAAVYPGDPAPLISSLKSIAGGDNFNFSFIRTGMHTGTHIDAPAHFLEHGRKLDEIPLDRWMGEAYLADFSKAGECIRDSDLKRIPLDKYNRIIIKTANSKAIKAYGQKFKDDFIYLHESACKLMAEAGVITVGFDYTTVDRPGTGSYPAHETLFKAGICIIESLDLSKAKEGVYFLISLPLKISGIEASPARAVLLRH